MAKSLVAKPQEPLEDAAVVRWTKWNEYDYASISDGTGTWYTTQDPRLTGKNKILPMSWDELLLRIGEQNWSSLEQLD